MKTSSIVTTVAAMLVCAAASAQTPVFGHATYAGMYTYNHADLNNDGREDLIYHTQTGFAVAVSNGPGSYAAPVSYNVPDNEPAGTITLGVNTDGYPDIIAFNGFDNSFHVYLNNGNGAFTASKTYQVGASIQDMAVGDFNHDGWPDIAFSTVSGSTQTLNVWFNNKNGGFTAGTTTSMAILGPISVGDFDGDGNADIATSNNQGTYLYFGDGTGHFTQVNATTAHDPNMYLMDIDGDGKSDLVGVASAGTDGQYGLWYRDIFVVYGNASRTITESEIPLNGYAVAWTWGSNAPDNSPSVDVADFNGDSKRDFALVEAQNQDGTGTRTLVVKPGNGNRTWGDEVNIYSNSDLDFGVAAIRATDALKPDLLVDTFDGSNFTAQFFLNNTSGGYFGGCEFPGDPIAIKICSPTTYTSTTAHFDASASGQTTMRKVEVWIDGVKKYQELATHDYSHYGLMDTTLTLTPGTHQVTIVAAGYDNLEEKQAYTVTVQ